ncbi:MAG: MerR family DNA-binding transcriptional regulator [Defluviitaleaceae bacterium]|nr:MerR family DNA-binding transcriptional regulator [Defluviitaleaceae bacterium]
MTNKNLISIGGMAKICEVSIKALRYYESIGILKPAYINPETNYRYYTIDQTHFAGLINFCINLDIPLKEMSKFTDANDIVNFRTFLAHCEKTAKKKLKAVNSGLKAIKIITQAMEFAESHQTGEIYSTEIPKKIFYTKPLGNSIENLNILEIYLSAFTNLPFKENDYYQLWEHGILCEYSNAEAEYFAFMEVPKYIINKENAHLAKTIPAGSYTCIQTENSQIENAKTLFKDHLADCKSFLAIETEIIIGKYQINKPLLEVRVIKTT